MHNPTQIMKELKAYGVRYTELKKAGFSANTSSGLINGQKRCNANTYVKLKRMLERYRENDQCVDEVQPAPPKMTVIEQIVDLQKAVEEVNRRAVEQGALLRVGSENRLTASISLVV